MSKDKIGLQLNGVETVRSPLIGSGECSCCVCCDRTRPEYYPPMYNGAIWAVSTDGTIGVLLPEHDEFEVKYHARLYRSWRLGSNHSESTMRSPILPPNVGNSSHNGGTIFPFWRDVIGFQTDVDQCVIFNAEGRLLYEGEYDGRRFPMFYNGHDRSTFTLDQFEYRTVAVKTPVVNTKTQPRFGDAYKIRWMAEGEEQESPTSPKFQHLGVGYAGVAWRTDWEVGNRDDRHCGYSADQSYEYYSTSLEYACEQPEDKDTPSGNIAPNTPVPFPRSLVRERTCPPPGAIESGLPFGDKLECEEEEVIRYHRCSSEFPPDMPLAHQIQGFELNTCGNFVRVILRNHQVSNNKWYRYVGTVSSEDQLPKHLPKDFDLEMLEERFGDFSNVPRDGWGVPLWWREYLQTYYVYGSHDSARNQWMVFERDDRKILENVKDLNIPGSLADDRRIERNEEKTRNHDPSQGELKLEQEFCEVPPNAERTLSRSAAGILPIPLAKLKQWNPYYTIPEETNREVSYGIRRYDVISVGGSDQDGFKSWFYFDGLDWVRGEGSYQDLKNWAKEDLNIIFYKGLEEVDQCEQNSHIIPASADRIQCCGDFLLIGLGTDYESRFVYFRNEILQRFDLDGFPTAEQHGKESFACCDSFFGFTILTLRNRTQSFFYNITLDDEGFVTKISRVEGWENSFPVEGAPQFGDCNPNCRYYFLRQNNKQGIYFYRDAENRGRLGIEYGPWQYLKTLNIQNDNNFAPGAGCASSTGECFIPCEAGGALAGSVRYFNGSQTTDTCEPREVCETTCESLPQETVTCGENDDDTFATVTPTLEFCEHYAAGDGVCRPEGECRLTSQSATLSPSSSHVLTQSPGVTTSDNQSATSEGTTYSSVLRSGSGDNFVSSAFLTFGSNPYNGTVSKRDLETGLMVHYLLRQCDNRLELIRLFDGSDSEGVVVDTANIGDVPGGLDGGESGSVSGGLPSVDTGVPWMLVATTQGQWGTGSSRVICEGKAQPSFSLPGRSTVATWIGGAMSSQSRHLTGRAEDALVAVYRSESCGAGGGVGTYQSCYWHARYQRLSGTVYIPDPYSESIVAVNTGLAGTYVSENGGTCVITNPCEMSAVAISVCINGKSYAVHRIEDADGNIANDRAVLIHGPWNDVGGERIVYEVRKYSGIVEGTEPEALFHCRFIDTGGPGANALCATSGYWEVVTSGSCTPGLFCSGSGYSASAHFILGTETENDEGVVERGEDTIVVDVDSGTQLWRYSVKGFIDEDHPPRLQCCGPYTILFFNDSTGYLYYRDEYVISVTNDWGISGCCNENSWAADGNDASGLPPLDGEEEPDGGENADGKGGAAAVHTKVCCDEAIIITSRTGHQRIFIEGREIDTSPLFEGGHDPHPEQTPANNSNYPVSVKCTGDGYYLFYCHRGNEIKWVEEYTCHTKTYTVKSLDSPSTQAAWEHWHGEEKPYDLEDAGGAVDRWMETVVNAVDAEGNPDWGKRPKLVLLDGTECEVVAARMMQTRGDSVIVGPGRWRTRGIERPPVRDSQGDILYPAVTDYEFDDPLAPWWGNNGEPTQPALDLPTKESGEGTMSLMRTLLGMNTVWDFNDASADPLELLRTKLRHLIAAKEEIPRLIRNKELEAAALAPGWGNQHFVRAIEIEIQGLQLRYEQLDREIALTQEQIRRVEAGEPPPVVIPPNPADRITEGNEWLWGFEFKLGRNIAAAYHCEPESRDPQYLGVNDPRLLDVKSYCGGQFGVFYFVGHKPYWWDTPIIERSSHYAEKAGVNALGDDTYKIVRTHFDMYLSLPNPQVHKELDHEVPQDTYDMLAMGDWLRKYTPYGAYVFDKAILVSANSDEGAADQIEPPFDEEKRFMDDAHMSHYGRFLFFNDRNAPVRYDRALSWEKPFEDACDHNDYRFDASTNYLRSPFTEGNDRLLVGGNGVLHVFDANMGRTDFNAETLEKIE